MDGRELQKTADTAARALPGVTYEHRVGPDWEVYKVRGKVFMLMTDMPGQPVVILKADPDEAVVLREQYPEISAGYHMDKRHWITAAGGAALDATRVGELVADSHRLVVDKLPRSERAALHEA
jgi:predicted DNA-binding protein (MmcQ/YjbR family)